MKKLLIGIVLALFAVPAWAGHVYINPTFCGPPGTDGVAATRIEATGLAHDYVGYQFTTAGNQVMACHFFMPDENPSYNFEATIHFRPVGAADGHNVILGVSLAANTVGTIYNDLDPHTFGSAIHASTVASAGTGTANETSDAVASVVPVWDTTTACVSDGTACSNREVVMWVQRINDNTACYDSSKPYDCCTGAGSGTCITGTDFSGDVVVLGVDLRY